MRRPASARSVTAWKVARRTSGRELHAAYRRARDLGLAFETVTFEDRGAGRSPLALGV